MLALDDLEVLAAKSGTPFFVYDADRIREKGRALRDALGEDLWIAYAVKANPHPEVIGSLRGVVDALDVSSLPELELALGLGWPGEALTFSGPAKKDDAIRRAAEVGARITAEAIDQIERIQRVAPAANLAVRVNPTRPVHAFRTAMGGRSSAFGIDQEQLGEVTAMLGELRGLQVFVGSSCSSVGAVVTSVVDTLDIAEPNPGLDWVSFGGGWAPGLDVVALGNKLSPIVRKFRSATGTTARFGFELGRYLVADAGLYVARIVSIKSSHEESYVILDGGMAHVMFATGRLGGEPAPLFNLTNPDGAIHHVHVAGPLCTPLDRFGSGVRPLTEPRVGDLVGVQNTGAYALTASPSGFIGHPVPAEWVLERGKIRGIGPY